jgi:hypothetical protein
MRLPAPIGPPVAFALVTLVVAGCAQVASVAPNQGPLVTVESRGGLCPTGTCAATVILERDGRVHQAAKPPNDLGVVPADTLAALESAIRTTDFTALRSHPFTGECPTAFDGQETVFEFRIPGGTERVSTCEVVVDFGSPLMAAVSNALRPFIPLPAP